MTDNSIVDSENIIVYSSNSEVVIEKNLINDKDLELKIICPSYWIEDKQFKIIIDDGLSLIKINCNFVYPKGNELLIVEPNNLTILSDEQEAEFIIKRKDDIELSANDIQISAPENVIIDKINSDNNILKIKVSTPSLDSWREDKIFSIDISYDNDILSIPIEYNYILPEILINNNREDMQDFYISGLSGDYNDIDISCCILGGFKTDREITSEFIFPKILESDLDEDDNTSITAINYNNNKGSYIRLHYYPYHNKDTRKIEASSIMTISCTTIPDLKKYINVHIAKNNYYYNATMQGTLIVEPGQVYYQNYIVNNHINYITVKKDGVQSNDITFNTANKTMVISNNASGEYILSYVAGNYFPSQAKVIVKNNIDFIDAKIDTAWFSDMQLEGQAEQQLWITPVDQSKFIPMLTKKNCLIYTDYHNIYQTDFNLAGFSQNGGRIWCNFTEEYGNLIKVPQEKTFHFNSQLFQADCTFKFTGTIPAQLPFEQPETDVVTSLILPQDNSLKLIYPLTISPIKSNENTNYSSQLNTRMSSTGLDYPSTFLATKVLSGKNVVANPSPVLSFSNQITLPVTGENKFPTGFSYSSHQYSISYQRTTVSGTNESYLGYYGNVFTNESNCPVPSSITRVKMLVQGQWKTVSNLRTIKINHFTNSTSGFYFIFDFDTPEGIELDTTTNHYGIPLLIHIVNQGVANTFICRLNILKEEYSEPTAVVYSDFVDNNNNDFNLLTNSNFIIDEHNNIINLNEKER